MFTDNKAITKAVDAATTLGLEEFVNLDKGIRDNVEYQKAVLAAAMTAESQGAKSLPDHFLLGMYIGAKYAEFAKR